MRKTFSGFKSPLLRILKRVESTERGRVVSRRRGQVRNVKGFRFAKKENGNSIEQARVISFGTARMKSYFGHSLWLNFFISQTYNLMFQGGVSTWTSGRRVLLVCASTGADRTLHEQPLGREGVFPHPGDLRHRDCRLPASVRRQLQPDRRL